MPQSFDKNNGTLLMLDTISNTEKIRCRSQAAVREKTVFTAPGRENMWLLLFWRKKAVLQSTFMIRHREKSIHTETVQDSNSTYFLRVPQILILDESGTCIVVLGRGY